MLAFDDGVCLATRVFSKQKDNTSHAIKSARGIFVSAAASHSSLDRFAQGAYSYLVNTRVSISGGMEYEYKISPDAIRQAIETHSIFTAQRMFGGKPEETVTVVADHISHFYPC